MSSEAKHTPGPWVIGGQSEGGKYININGGGRIIARVMFSKPTDPFPADDANARLIAAAPDLLEALKKCRSELHLLKDGSVGGVPNTIAALIHERIELADAAIAKATGGEA